MILVEIIKMLVNISKFFVKIKISILNYEILITSTVSNPSHLIIKLIRGVGTGLLSSLTGEIARFPHLKATPLDTRRRELFYQFTHVSKQWLKQLRLREGKVFVVCLCVRVRGR